jgi:hypothetical protein
MRGVMVLFVIALGLAGCKTQQTPTADPFSLHPIVPPPATGSTPLPSNDPGYAPRMPGSQPSAVQPGLSVNNTGQPAIGTSTPGGVPSGAWTVPGSTSQPPISSNPTSSPAVSPPSYSAPNPGIPNSGLSTPGASTANPVNPGYSAPGYGAANPAALPGRVPVLGNSALGTSTATIIPPPSTAAPGTYPNSSISPPPTSPGPGTMGVADNRFLPPSGMNNLRGATPTYPTAPIAGTPRPTPSQTASSFAHPTTAIPSNSPLDYRNLPHPVDEAAQPIRSPSAPYSNVPANSTTTPNSVPLANRYASNGISAAQPGVAAAPISQPRQMPIPPTAYGSPLAAPPYCASIQRIEPDWQPCDGYADDGQ